MSLLHEFLEEIEAFLATHGIEPTTFGRDVLKDPNFVADLRAGRSPNLRTIDKVRQFIARRVADKPARAAGRPAPAKKRAAA